MPFDLAPKKTELQTMVNNAKTLHAEIERKRAAGESVDPLDVEKLEKMISDGQVKRKELASLEALSTLDGEFNTPGERKATPNGEGGAAEPFRGERKTRGDLFIESKEFKALKEGQTDMARMSVKAILGETALSGGETIRADRQMDVVGIARQRPPSMIDLVNHSQTTLNSVDYVRMTSRTDAAAIVAEAAAKPESDMAFDVITVPVKVIATWVKASNQILDDAPNLRNIIDNELDYMVKLKLENLIIADAIANAGQSRVHAVSGRAFAADDSIADSIRRAITDIRLEFYDANGVVLHPTQAEAMELEKASDGHYVMIYDPVGQRVWRIAVVDTPAMTSGTGLVGNFLLGYTVWDRMDAAVKAGYVNDDFTKNLVTILGELRAAYGVVRPKAIEKITGM